jgi:colanic acid/amylovoran biosynthesis glycosyltransferase
MRIAYLVNRYPTISHTFIRREILGLEKLGVSVRRFTLRAIRPEELRDPRDEAERLRTEAVLARGPAALLPAMLRMSVERPREFANAQLLVAQMGIGSERGYLRHMAYLAEACALTFQLEADRVQHMHAHFGTNSAAVARLVAALGGPGYSFTVHGPEEFDKPDRIALAHKIAAARFVVAVSSYGRSQLLRYCDAEAWDKVHIVRCGVDASYLEETSPVPEVPRFVNVARLSEQKGQLLLVEAAAMLRREGRTFELVLVGDGPLRKVLETRIAQEGLAGCVHLMGWADGDAVKAELVRARALVLPSFAEGLPVVIMEALACGRPVISTYIAGIPELVENGKTGWLVPAGSAEAVAQAMREALDAPAETLTRFGAAGRARVRAQHDADTNARQLLDLFELYASR